MERIAFDPSVDIYNQYDFTTDGDFMNNRLFATFTQLDAIENLIDDLSSSYDIMYNKMFVLFVKSTNEYVITYNVDRDDLLGVFMGMPVHIQNLPSQISGGDFEGYVEGWSWSTRFNELFLTINVSPVAFSQVAMRWTR